MRAPLVVMLALALAPAAACWAGPAPEPPRSSTSPPANARPPLYERLGGRSAISAIAEQAVQNLVGDRRLQTFFANADVPRLRRQLEQWLCAAAGAPCRYTGKSLRAAHAGMAIGSDDFEAFVDAFAVALDRLGIRGRERVEVLLIIRRARPDIVVHEGSGAR
jgi:hemoglobin